MFHAKIYTNGDIAAQKPNNFALWAYLSTHEIALGHAAVLLGGRRGARLINSIQDSLAQPRPITRRLRHQLVELQQLLFLDHSYDGNWSDDACFAMPEPDDAIVAEICLLADGLQDVLREARLIGTED